MSIVSYLYEDLCCMLVVIFFFFKQKTAYEMRISDWSSDVCSSDLLPQPARDREERPGVFVRRRRIHQHSPAVAARNAEIAAERGVAGQRCDLSVPQAVRCQEIGRGGRGRHVGNHRSLPAAGMSDAKDRRRSRGFANAPARHL